MKKIIVLLAIFIFFNWQLCLAEENYILEPEKELKIGETLKYSVEVLGIPIGKIILKVEGITKLNRHECYRITAEATINKFFSRFYDLEYKVETYMDKESMVPRRFTKIRRMKDIFTYLVIDFNQEDNLATYEYSTPSGPVEITDFPSLRKETVINEIVDIKIPPNTQDLFSAFYYFRLLKIEEQKQYFINIFYHKDNWPVKISVGRTFLRELRKKGVFKVISISLDSDLNDYILGKRGITTYFTTDSRRIPVEILLHTAIGSIRGIIQEMPE